MPTRLGMYTTQALYSLIGTGQSPRTRTTARLQRLFLSKPLHERGPDLLFRYLQENLGFPATGQVFVAPNTFLGLPGHWRERRVYPSLGPGVQFSGLFPSGCFRM